MLVELGNKLVNLDQVLWIEHIGKDRDSSQSSLVRFANGETLQVSGDLDWIGKKVDRIITAPPGMKVIRGWFDAKSEEGKKCYFETIPIIAFRYRGEHEIIIDPITIEGVPDDNWVIVDHDGKCWDVNGTYENAEAFKKAFETEQEQRAASTKVEAP